MTWLAPIDLLGSVAGLLTTASFVPQVVKTLRSGQTRDISLAMWLAYCTGATLWLIYGIALGAWPIIVSNALTLGLAGTILTMKIRTLRQK